MDLETTKKSLPFYGGDIRLMQIKTKKDLFVIDFFKLSNEEKKYFLNTLFNYYEGVIVFHNALFDLLFILHYIFIHNNNLKIFDTMVAAKILDCGINLRGFSLKDLSKKYLNIELNKNWQGSNWETEILIPEQIEYAKEDAKVTFELYEIFQLKLNENNLNKCFNIDMECLIAIANCISGGIKLDKNKWKTIIKDLEIETKNIENEIFNFFGERFNLNSPAQVIKYLNKLNIGSVQETNIDYLNTIKNKNPIIEKIILYRIKNKKLTSFGYSFLEMLDEKDRIHPRYNLARTSTGRLSCVEPNIQQIPRDNKYRSCFIAEEGNVIIKADYSQIELRIIASLSGDLQMLKAFKEEIDLHKLTASKVLNIPEEEINAEQRKKAKSINFGFVYSMGAKNFVTYAKTNFDLDVDLKQAEIFKRKFFHTYPKLKIWHNKLEKKDYSITLGGRVRKYSQDYYRGELYNTPVQGTGADILKVALNLVYKRIICSELHPAKIIAIVHDEIVLECKETDSERISGELKNCMKEAWYQFIADVKIDVDITIGKSWGG